MGEAGKGSSGAAVGKPAEGWRKGRRYGTILVDLECNEVVELLPDRKAETLSSWLQQHPSVEIIARDRASAYAEGARDGAPAAVQVADRWHMLRSLGGAVRQAIERYQGVARQVASEITAAPRAADVSPDAAAEPLVTVAPVPEVLGPTKRQADFAEATRLAQAGNSISRVSRLLGVGRKTHVNPYGAFHLDMSTRLPLDMPGLHADSSQLSFLSV